MNEARRTLASRLRASSTARNLGLAARRVCLSPPRILAVKRGRNFSLPHFLARNLVAGFVTDQAAGSSGLAPPPKMSAAIRDLRQLVGLIVNFLRVIATSILRMPSFAPPKTSGMV